MLMIKKLGFFIKAFFEAGLFFLIRWVFWLRFIGSLRLVLTLGLCFISFFTLIARANNFDIFHLENSVYRISNNRNTHGTAFAIGPNLFITNFHVIKGFVYNRPKQIILSNKQGETFNFDRLLRLGNNETIDLALFTTKQNVPSYLKIKNLSINPGEKLFSLGFPGKVFRKTILGISRNFDEPIDKHYYMPYERSYDLSGASGSPVFNQRGQVVAVMETTTSLVGTPFVLGIKSKYLQDFIQGNLGLKCSGSNLKYCIERATSRKKYTNRRNTAYLSLTEAQEKSNGGQLKNSRIKLSTCESLFH